MVSQDVQAPEVLMARPDQSDERVFQVTPGRLVTMELMVTRDHEDQPGHQ